jgi:hypothetical protein
MIDPAIAGLKDGGETPRERLFYLPPGIQIVTEGFLQKPCGFINVF